MSIDFLAHSIAETTGPTPSSGWTITLTGERR
jgi:hypothetical protein